MWSVAGEFLWLLKNARIAGRNIRIGRASSHSFRLRLAREEPAFEASQSTGRFLECTDEGGDYGDFEGYEEWQEHVDEGGDASYG